MQINQHSINFFSFQFDVEKIEHSEKQFIKRLKEEIPSDARKWFPEKKVWLIHINYFDEFIYLLEKYLRDKVIPQEELF